MKLSSHALAASSVLLACVHAAVAAPFAALAGRTPTTGHLAHADDARPVRAVAIWHGLGDRYNNPGLVSLGEDIKAGVSSDIYVHFVRTSNDSNADQRSTLFGNMGKIVEDVAKQLKDTPELADGFDAIGLSQGGVFWRGYVERYAGRLGYPAVRNLITLGSPHMGISSSPPCHPTDFFCKSTQWALRAGVWTPYAQSGVVPAQYFRNQATIEDYLSHNSFLRDINNERTNDTQPASGAYKPSLASNVASTDEKGDISPRNQSYREAILKLNNLVLLAFDDDKTVIPSASPHFTLPSSDSTSAAPLPSHALPLYQQDYIGLRELDENKGLHKAYCQGEHMQIDDSCWADVMSWLGDNGKGRGPRHRNDTLASSPKIGLVLQVT